MTNRSGAQKAARRLQKEFRDVSSYSAVLRLVREVGEEGARKQLAEWARSADAELAKLKE